MPHSGARVSSGLEQSRWTVKGKKARGASCSGTWVAGRAAPRPGRGGHPQASEICFSPSPLLHPGSSISFTPKLQLLLARLSLVCLPSTHVQKHNHSKLKHKSDHILSLLIHDSQNTSRTLARSYADPMAWPKPAMLNTGSPPDLLPDLLCSSVSGTHFLPAFCVHSAHQLSCSCVITYFLVP